MVHHDGMAVAVKHWIAVTVEERRTSRREDIAWRLQAVQVHRTGLTGKHNAQALRGNGDEWNGLHVN